jgi:ABC-type antimicrobial peptide transport system permease subunit
MNQFLIEVLVVGILTAIIGIIVSQIMMSHDAVGFKHWDRVTMSYFITGALIHIICEYTNINTWYCKKGNACIANYNFDVQASTYNYPRH